MKKPLLLLAALLLSIASTQVYADRLYLNNIECTAHKFENKDDFSFKSIFTYDDFDNIAKIETNQHIDSKHVIENVTVGQPPYYIFNFGYEQNRLTTASYADGFADSLDATFKTSDTAEGKTVEADVEGVVREPDINYTLKAEYNNDGELVCTHRLTDNSKMKMFAKYEYSYDEKSRISIVKALDANGTNTFTWRLLYGSLGELSQCLGGLPTEFSDEVINGRSILKFSYDKVDADVEVVSPEPNCFIYDALDINPEFTNTYTLYIPEIVARILQSQDRLAVKSIEQSSNVGTFTFGCNYTLVSGIDEVNADKDYTPEYYNIQGMKVANPQEGEIYIVKRGTRATKEVYRR